MTLNPTQLGLIRGLGLALLMTVLTYFGNAAHLNGLVSAGTASLISMFALSLEHYLEEKNGKALFGMARQSPR